MSTKSFQLSALYLFILIFLKANSFGQSLQWAKEFGGAGWDEATSIVTDENNHVYAVGLFIGTVDFDPGLGVFNLTSVGEKDAFICKLDDAGNFMWAKQYGDSAFIDEKSSLGIDSLGNLYTTNSFLGMVDFDPGPGTFSLTSNGLDRDIYIQKLDKNGNFIWAKQISGQTSLLVSTPVHSNAIAVDAGGNHFITGYFDGTIDFDPGPGTFDLSAISYSDCFICKLDASGNFVWAKQFEGTQGEVGYSICLDKNGNVYSTGTIGGTTDFDPGPGTFNLSQSVSPHTEIYISKLDSLGNFLWAKAMGPGEGSAIGIDDDNNVYSTGWVPSAYTAVINKLDSSGNFIWAKPLGGINGESIALDSNNNVFTTGICYGTSDFDPGPGVFNLTGGSSDSFISKLDSSGNFVWAGLLTGTNQVWSKSLTIALNNHLYVTGYFDETTDFDMSTTSTFNLSASSQSYNIFIVKLSTNQTAGISENNFEEKIQTYPNPTEGNLVIEFEGDPNDLNLVLRNVLGQAVNITYTTTEQGIEIQIDGESGIYLLEVSDQNNHKTVLKIIKQ